MNSSTTTIQYIDRMTGRVMNERVCGERAVRWAYETTAGRLLASTLLRTHTVSKIYGWMQRRASTRKKIHSFIRDFDINTHELQSHVEDYKTFDDFFTRRLKPEARPIDEMNDHLISPVDARVLVRTNLQEDRLPTIKGYGVNLTDLVGDAELANLYRGGDALVARLAPVDYHRFHFPDSGRAGPSVRYGWGLHSVHIIALASGAPSFLNHRMRCILDSDHFGQILMIEIGALLVGSIVQTYSPGTVARGQEKGLFRFGGSTVILLIEPNRIRFDDDLVQASSQDLETLVKLGTRIAVAQ